MKQHREKRGVLKKKRRKDPDVYYPGMVAEAISGTPDNLSNVLFKKRKDRDNNIVTTSVGGEENSIIIPHKKKQKQQMKTSISKMKQHREEREELKKKKRKAPDVYYPGMVAEAISGVSGNLSNVSEMTDVLFKNRKDEDSNIVTTSVGGEENSIIVPIMKKKKQQIAEKKSDGNTIHQINCEYKSATIEKMSAHMSRSNERLKITKNGLEDDRYRCTVFVGNLPNTITKKRIIKYFKKFGTILNTRLRCAAVSDPRLPKRRSVIKKDFHKDRSNIHAYVRFGDESSANRALEANGNVFEGYHLRVDLAAQKEHENKKAVFVGNLAFSVEEDDLWELFEKCGPIDSIRIVRDQRTGMGKGFGYVNFKSEDSVELALQLNGEIVKERPIRVNRYGNLKQHNKKLSSNTEPEVKQITKKQKLSTAGSTSSFGKKVRSEHEEMSRSYGTKPEVGKMNNTLDDFQGRTALARKKKKKKVSTYVVKKKRITQQLNSTSF